VKIWDIPTGLEILPLPRPTVPVGSLRWSTDGRQLIAENAKGVCRVWDATRGYQAER
jgi:WD40 repeat protein